MVEGDVIKWGKGEGYSGTGGNGAVCADGRGGGVLYPLFNKQK
jgi:hypothetical protein